MSDLFASAMAGDLEALRSAEKIGGLDVKNDLGSTLLFYAVMSDNPAVLEFLTSAGLSVNSQRKDGETPLHIACIRNKVNAARWLLSHGANPGLKDQWSRRPVDCLGEGSSELRQLLAGTCQESSGTPLSISDFTVRLRSRLEARWQCPDPKGFSDSELKAVLPSGEHMPEIYKAFLQICGKEMGQLFRSYEFRPNETAASTQEFEGFLDNFGVRVAPAIHFLAYLREEYWAFSRHRTGSELDDPMVLHITVQGVQPINSRLSNFLLDWEQYE